MPGFLLTAAATVTCSHGGQVKIAPAQIRALAGGAPIATLDDQLVVAGCPGIPASPGLVCTKVQWTGTASRVTASGLPVLVQSLPPGPVPGDGTVVVGPAPPLPLVAEVQLKVVAT
jgi:hypothetical protein